MKVSNIQSFQSFNGIKDKFKTNKAYRRPKVDYDVDEYYNKYIQDDIKTGTIASLAAATVLLAGVLGSGIAFNSARRSVSAPEVSKIPSDVADSSYVDVPSQQEADMFYVDNKFDVRNKTNPTDKYESEAKSDSDDEVVVEPALEEGKATEQEAKVEQEVSPKSEETKEPKKSVENEPAKTEDDKSIEDSEVVYEPEDVEYIEESEEVYEPEDVEYVYEPENSNPFINNDFINPEIGLPPQFPPPYIWNPEISDGNEINESKMEFKSPFDGKTVKETGRDEVAGSVLFDDGSILVEKSGILYSANGMYVDFNEYMEEGEGMPVPIRVSQYNTDSFVFDDIKIGDETFYPIGMTEDGNVKFNDGSIVDVNTGLVTRTNGSVYHYITGDMLTGPVDDSEIVIDNDKPRYPYPAFPPFYDPITGEEHKEVERTKTSIMYDDGSVFDIATGKTTRPDGSVWGYGPVLLQVPEDPSGLAPYKDEENNVHYAIACDVENNTATFDDESKFFVENGLLIKADGSMWSWDGCTTTLPERLPQVEPVPGDPLPPPITEP